MIDRDHADAVRVGLDLEQLCRDCSGLSLDQVDAHRRLVGAGFAHRGSGREHLQERVRPPGSRKSNVTTPAGRGTIG